MNNSVLETTIFVIFGYLSGSVLYIDVAQKLFHKGNLSAASEDHNPGTFNAFKQGGFQAGMLTLTGDILKGVIPVSLYLHLCPETAMNGLGFSLVLAAPVFGHIYSCFHHFHGGKGIAVTFGVLLGLVPDWKPVLILAFLFLFFSLIIKINPDSIKTALVFLLLPICSFLFQVWLAVIFGEALIVFGVLARLYTENLQVASMEIRPFWMKAEKQFEE
ncbi:glycerol-3-phosphate acyltransferase [Ileibacterium valens]|uniref:glycerol-3-phosphate acyltransferase n=1 Tax=Ileibacterium valens TaxID=1862668 RepID=UPI0024B8B8DD|nr:glycerol-3-phosphate acyltransferase [Ileibacterium valens]